MRWRQKRGGIVSVAEASRIDESRSDWGSRFGAIAAARTGTVQNRVLLSMPLGGTWRVLVGYPREEPGAGKPQARIREGESRMAELLDHNLTPGQFPTLIAVEMIYYSQ